MIVTSYLISKKFIGTKVIINITACIGIEPWLTHIFIELLVTLK